MIIILESKDGLLRDNTREVVVIRMVDVIERIDDVRVNDIKRLVYKRYYKWGYIVYIVYSRFIVYSRCSTVIIVAWII